jgi:hypothetical protein
MCRATNAGTLIPTCEACVAQFPITDNDDNDRRDRDGDRDDVNGSFGFRLSTLILRISNQIVQMFMSSSPVAASRLQRTTHHLSFLWLRRFRRGLEGVREVLEVCL